MTTPYAGDPTSYPATITIPDDGDAPIGTTFGTPYEQLADRTAYIGGQFVGLHAMTWRPYIGLNTITGPSEVLKLATCLDANRVPWMIRKSSSAVQLAKSRNFFGSIQACTQIGTVAVSAIWGDVDRASMASVNDLIVIGDASKLYYSSDVGATWSAAVVLGATCTVVARAHRLSDMVIVAGVNVIKTMNSTFGALTSRTVPASWAALTPAGIAVARGGESNTAGIVAWPASAVSNVMHSPDGVTWTNQSVAVGQVAGACWHEPAALWFCVTTAGRVYSSPNPSTDAWTLVKALDTAGVYYSIKSFGPSLVIVGTAIGDTRERGSIVTTVDRVNWYAMTAGAGVDGVDGFETTLQHFDGQLVAGHIHTYVAGPTYVPDLSVSMRGPWY